jgi:hypothetical protein
MGQSVLKVATAIVAGAILISLFQSSQTGGVINSITGGFSSIIGAMKGGTPAASTTAAVANTGLATASSPAAGAHA